MESDVSGTARRSAGRLVTDEPILERFEERAEPVKRYREDYRQTKRVFSPGTPKQTAYYLIEDPTQVLLPKDWQALTTRKQEAREQSSSKEEVKDKGGKRGILGLGGKEGSVLSKQEVNQLREPLQAALKDDLKYFDEFLWWYSKDGNQPQIWSDLDDEEIETLASVLLRRGERNPATANFVRNVVDSNDYISTAVIVVPRLIKTTQQVSKRPRQPREKRKRA